MDSSQVAYAIRLAILAEPDEVLHRLAYADHLEEIGNLDYAQFIRWQLAIRKQEPDCRGPFAGACAMVFPEKTFSRFACPSCRQWFDTQTSRPKNERATVMNILRALPAGRRWVAWPNTGQPNALTARLVGGFVEEVAGTRRSLTQHLPQLLRKHPIRVVTLTDAILNVHPQNRYVQLCNCHMSSDLIGIIQERYADVLQARDNLCSTRLCNQMRVSFVSRELAMSALSDAMLVKARRRSKEHK